MCVTDVADALTALLDSNVSGAVNIGSGRPISIRELMSLIAEKLNSSQRISYRNNLAEKKDPLVTADVTRLSSEVKWQPRYSLDAALNETINWWRGQV